MEEEEALAESDPQDPAKLLPYSKELEPRDPTVERLPKAYGGTGQIFFNQQR